MSTVQRREVSHAVRDAPYAHADDNDAPSASPTPDPVPLLTEPVDAILALFEAAMNAKNKKIQPCTIYYALSGLTVTHSEFNDGKPFALDDRELLDGIARAAGGGKAIFYLYASIQRFRVGHASKELQQTLRSVGLEFAPLKTKAVVKK